MCLHQPSVTVDCQLSKLRNVVLIMVCIVYETIFRLYVRNLAHFKLISLPNKQYLVLKFTVFSIISSKQAFGTNQLFFVNTTVIRVRPADLVVGGPPDSPPDRRMDIRERSGGAARQGHEGRVVRQHADAWRE